jgi:hypothetical protein
MSANFTRRSRRRGISVMEVAVASMLTAVVMVAALQAAGQTLLARRRWTERSVGHLLADSLLTEIRALPYCEPGTTEPSIGSDSGETAGVRSSFDDVDDFHNYSDSPPTTRAGALLANHVGWSRNVTVQWVDPTNLTSAGTQSGAKRITVSAAKNGVTVYTATAVRTDSY